MTMEKKDAQVVHNMVNTHRKESLLVQFEEKQREMVRKGMELGVFTHPTVVQISQELDGIHNQILRKNNNQRSVKPVLIKRP